MSTIAIAVSEDVRVCAGRMLEGVPAHLLVNFRADTHHH